jgi:hypothetical protein
LVNLSFSHCTPLGDTFYTVTVSLFKSDGVHFPQSMVFIAPAANFPTTITGAIAKVTITSSTANGLLFANDD